jgi:hypothetical protein
MMRTARTSPRQALVVMAPGPRESHVGALIEEIGEIGGEGAAEELLRCRLLDLIGMLIQVDGASISVVGRVSEVGGLAGLVPAGVDVLPVDEGNTPMEAVVSGVRWHLDRDFERVVALLADAFAVPSRTVSTGLSALGGADLVIGPTPSGGLYLLGVRDHRSLEVALPGNAPPHVAGGSDARALHGPLVESAWRTVT